MNAIEDFESAPVGATATRADGSRIMKTDNGGQQWLIQDGFYVGAREMAEQGCTLDRPAPASAREALELAWELAHEVKEGQTIPEGTRYLEVTESGVKAQSALFDIELSPTASEIRTVEPLPDPEPGWLDAPAVLAHTDNDSTRGVWTVRDDGLWVSTSHSCACHWRDLRDVAPLCLKGQEA